MGWSRRRPDPAARVAQLRAEREQLAAELEVVESDAAWGRVSDSRSEQVDAASLDRQAAALRAELNRLDVRLLRAELDMPG